MAVTNAAASGIEGWVRRLVESERKVAVLETNQRDLGKAVGQTASDLSWEVDQWNNTRRFDNASSQVSTLNNWWTAKKNAVYGFDKLAMPAETVDLQGLAALAAEETHSDGEKAVKGQLLASQQRLLELSAKQKDLRSAVDSLRGSANFEVDQWNNTTRFNNDGPKSATLRQYWETLKTGIFSLSNQLK